MKKLGFEHQGTATYLVYELGPEDNVDSMSLGMLVNNQISGFAPTIVTQRDNVKQVKCNVTAQVTADQYLLGSVNKKMLIGVFQGIAQAFLSAEEYMIDPDTIQLELGSIFVDVATGKTAMICVPVLNGRKRTEEELRTFLKEILFGAQYDERENRDYVAKIMSYLNGAPSFSVREFKDLLDYVDISPAVQQPIQQQAQSIVADREKTVSENIQSGAVSQPKSESVSTDAHTKLPSIAENPPKEKQQQMSLFYLLQHYNKDNAAIYKEGKEIKKAEKEEAKREKAEKKEAEKRERAAKKKKGKAKDIPHSFEVPGRDAVPSGAEKSSFEECASAPAQQQPGQSVASTPAQPIQQLPQQPIRAPMSQPMQPQFQETASSAYPQQIEQMPAPPLQYSSQMSAAGVIVPNPEAKDRVNTVYFAEEGTDATVIMGQEPQTQRLFPHLIRKRNQERIPINKAVFRLGRDRDYNDYPMVDNRYIGHSHCHIICRDGEYFVVDDNSKNRTKVNGTVIMPGEETKIAHGDVLCLADEEFEFKLF